MSAIAGYWNLNAAPACEDTISRMIGPLKRRGPDGVNLSVSGPLALAHVCLATTPQARTEILPLSHPETGCVILADARLDYRDELEAKLGLDCAGRMVRDGELILQSYLRWGTSCLNHLEGDFAFVLFDPREKRLFAARDLPLLGP